MAWAVKNTNETGKVSPILAEKKTKKKNNKKQKQKKQTQ